MLAVVDPGVGTARRAVASRWPAGAGVLVGPDNGLLAPAVAIIGGAERAVELTNPDYHLAAPGATFAGRDIFAPSPPTCATASTSPSSARRRPGLLMPGMVPLPREEPDGSSTPRCCGSTASATASSTSAPTTSPAGTSRCGGPTIGDERRIARTATVVRRARGGSVGLVLDSHGMYALALDQRSAAAELRLAPATPSCCASVVDDDPASPPPTSPVELRRDR